MLVINLIHGVGGLFARLNVDLTLKDCAVLIKCELSADANRSDSMRYAAGMVDRQCIFNAREAGINGRNRHFGLRNGVGNR